MDSRSDVWNDYVRFFNRLGFRTFGKRPFHPFYSEIVEVTYDPEIRPGRVYVDSVCWPGVMFGNMMFSRSGVRVSCCKGTLNKEVAEHSTLYFTYRRTRRTTNDMSMGSGSNSQWGTDFRREYVDERMFHFNVDGVCELGPNYEATCPPHERFDLEELTMEEKIELLVHRCFVKCEKESQWDRFPFFDRYSMPKLREMRYRNTTGSHITSLNGSDKTE